MISKKINIVHFVLLLIFAILVFYRILYFNFSEKNICTCLTWDSLGYYMYLPGAFIYKDIFHFSWLQNIFTTYQLPGDIYQYRNLPNGNVVGYYQIGVAILEIPFFLMGHLYAKIFNYSMDGFSIPYQIAISFSGIFYASAGLLLIKNVLQKYYSNAITAITLIIIALGTNYLQYSAVEGGQVHSFCFFTLALVLYCTQKLDNHFTKKNILFIALAVGLAILVRPTDGIALFIPLLWKYKNLENWSSKKIWFKNNLKICISILLCTFIMCLPQIIYWKMVSGDWLHPAGSSWRFLWPYFRVLIGGEKGWFIYTPLTILFVIGFFYTKNIKWHTAILTFFIFNIWIVIAWNDWRYGSSYSCRALMQGMAIGCLPMASAVHFFISKKQKIIFGFVLLYFIANNLFQIYQYNKGIIIGVGNSWGYYKSIYWKAPN